MSEYSALLVDLDGTLVQFETDRFIHQYLSRIVKHFDSLPNASSVPNWILGGTDLMLNNVGTVSNKEIFIDYFSALSGLSETQIWKIFLHFYQTDFRNIGYIARPIIEMVNLINRAQKQGYRIVIATQPIFPEQAVLVRMEWGGAEKIAYEFITHIENSRACKPNPLYFEDILKRLNLSASQCLMIGNDAQSDLGAQKTGIDTFIIGDDEISENLISSAYRGDVSDLKKLLNID